MKLNEILDKVKVGTKSWQEVLDDLGDKYFLKRFSGSQAEVIESKDKKHVYRFWIEDDGYEDWYKIAKAKHSNQHIIKFASKIRNVEAEIDGKKVNLKFVKLEKLDEIEDKDALNAIEILDETRFRIDYNALKKMSFEEFLDKTISMDGGNESFVQLTDGGKAFLEKNKSFIEMYFELLKLGFNDLNTRNIMRRGNTLVFVDPYV